MNKLSKPKKNAKTSMVDRHISKPFLPMLIDAVLYAKYASLSKDKSLKDLLVKASILHCSIVVESLANNMIQFINLGSKFSESIDKLDVISKFELFSMLTKKNHLNRGSNSIQAFKELIDIRNKYVHPKIRTEELINENGKLSSKSTKSLSQIKIPVDLEKWDVKESNKCVLALLKAIDQFLIDELGLEMKSMSCMFMDSLSVDGNTGSLVIFKDEWTNWTSDVLHYNPRFYCDHILKRFESVLKPRDKDKLKRTEQASSKRDNKKKSTKDSTSKGRSNKNED